MREISQLLLSISLLLTAFSNDNRVRWYHIVILILAILTSGITVKEDFEQLRKL